MRKNMNWYTPFLIHPCTHPSIHPTDLSLRHTEAVFHTANSAFTHKSSQSSRSERRAAGAADSKYHLTANLEERVCLRPAVNVITS